MSSLQTFTTLPAQRAMARLRGINSSEIRAAQPGRKTKFWLISACIFAVLSIILGIAVYGALAETAHLKAGVEFLKSGKLDNSISELTASMTANQSVTPYYYRALAYSEGGKNESALQDYDYVISQQPKQGRAWIARACQNLKMGRFTEAKSDCTQSLTVEPTYAQAYRVRAAVELATARNADCIKDCQEFLAKTQQSSDLADRVNALKMMAAANGQLRDYNKVIDCYNQAIALDPFSQNLYENKAEVLRRQGSLKEAIDECTAAIKIKESTDTYKQRAALYKANHQLKEALTDVNSAIKLDEKDVDLRRQRGELEKGLHQYEQAYADYKYVMLACPGSKRAKEEYEQVRSVTPQAMRHD